MNSKTPPRLQSLRGVLMRYLAATAVQCAIVVLLWWGALTFLVGYGVVLRSDASAHATMEAQDSLKTGVFEPETYSSLCRYLVFSGGDPDRSVVTNMDDRHLAAARAQWRNEPGPWMLYRQYYMRCDLPDGRTCLLQYDYAMPYADPVLRGLPDFQTCWLLVLVVLLVWRSAAVTRRFACFLTREVDRLTAASDAIARQELDGPQFTGARVREFDAVLTAMARLDQSLQDSLRARWTLEQQRAEQTAALAHDLKTPLAVITGNADLLAEEALTAPQRQCVEAIQRGAGRAGQYLQALCTVNRAERDTGTLRPMNAADFLRQRKELAEMLCGPKKIQFVLKNTLPGDTVFPAQADALARAVENLLENAVRFTPPGGTVTLSCRAEQGRVVFVVEDTGPGFSPEALQKAGQELYTGDTARTGEHWGLGLSVAARVARDHGGGLTLANRPRGGALVRLWVRAA